MQSYTESCEGQFFSFQLVLRGLFLATVSVPHCLRPNPLQLSRGLRECEGLAKATELPGCPHSL